MKSKSHDDEAERLRVAGDDAYASNKLETAIERYTESLNICLDFKTLEARSRVYLELENFAEAYIDASHAIMLNPTKQTHSSIQGQAELKLFQKISQSNHASQDFMGAVEVFDTIDNCGRGVRCSRAIGEGELLFVCSPLFLYKDNNTLKTSSSSKKEALSNLSQQVLACKDEDILLCVNDLDDGEKDGSNNSLDVSKVLAHNVFQLTDYKFALYHLASMLNHACASNALVVFYGNTLVVRAARALPVHEQVTIRYFSTLDLTVKQRCDLSIASWAFECRCWWCTQETLLFRELEPLYKLKSNEIPLLCQRFFHFLAEEKKLMEIKLEMASVMEKIEKVLSNLSMGPEFRAVFAGGFQVYRALCERLNFVKEAMKIQDLLLEMNNRVEPASFENCKSCLVAERFASQHPSHKKRWEVMAKELTRVHEVRYGGRNNIVLLQHALTMTQQAVMDKNPQEWTLFL